MKGYTVEPISYQEAKPWILKKHYSKRMPSNISYSFGLLKCGQVIGVCLFGTPASRFDLCGDVYELSRLVVEDDSGKNCASTLIAGAIKQMPPSIIVSYADKNMGHVGYVYQATNWIYTGLSSAEHYLIINGKRFHRKGCYNVYGTSSIPGLEDMGLNVEVKPEIPKHRYFQASGCKRFRKQAIKSILEAYHSIPYPKGESKRYDASAEFHKQVRLF